jgi:hypothetical protein
MEKMLKPMPHGLGALQIKNTFVEGFGNPLLCKEARTTALEMTDAEKGSGGSLL